MTRIERIEGVQKLFALRELINAGRSVHGPTVIWRKKRKQKIVGAYFCFEGTTHFYDVHTNQIGQLKAYEWRPKGWKHCYATPKVLGDCAFLRQSHAQ